MRRAFFALLAAIVLLLVGASHADQTKPAWVLIVHPKNNAPALERKFVEDAFLKKISSWPGGDQIKPVDLAPDSAVRRAFTADVLRRSIEEVRRYWQQRIFSGRDVPPLELGSEADVVKYVASHENAVGYVSGATDVGGTKVIAVH